MFRPDGIIMGVLNWITRLLYVQLVWALFVVIGLGIGGIFPATFTLFGINRKWIREHTDFPVFSTFWKMYKESFVKTNLIGWLMALFAFSIYFYYTWFLGIPGILTTVGLGVLLVLGFIFLIVSMFVMPVYAHYEVVFLNVFKNAAVTAISHPLHAVGMLIMIIIHIYIFTYLPIIFLFFGVSTLVFILMYISYAAFQNIERKLAE